MKGRFLERLGASLLALGIATTTVSGALLVATMPASAATVGGGTTDSAVTVTWLSQHADQVPTSTPTPSDSASPDPISSQSSTPSSSSTPTSTPSSTPSSTASSTPSSTPTETAAPTPTDTAVPQDESDYSAFKDLSFTVSQTKNLTNQGITISWDGGRRTSLGEYATDYMQIMQCWGDPATGPTPETCQFGAPVSSVASLMGTNTPLRDLVQGQDPAQDAILATDSDYKLEAPPEDPFQRAFRVPFRTVNGVLAKSTNEIGKYFTTTSSNEIDAARTATNGSGIVSFETQTSLEAPQLGCGGSAAACYVVIVPRGELNIDGESHNTVTSGRIFGSPLSAAAWKNRVVIPLEFQSVAQNCAIGNDEVRLLGADASSAAVTSWQAALCASSGTTYGFSQIGDGEARRQIVSETEGASRMALISDPLDDTLAKTGEILYAPVAQSSIVVAFTIDYNVFSNTANAGKNGLQVEDVTLNARLVAKLLTQSYRVDIPNRGVGTSIEKNPISILNDPEFISLNPGLIGFQPDTVPGGLVTALGSTDANSEVWSWLRSDPLASDFLKGNPDDNGMTINPAYLPLDLADDTSVDYFPKTDPSTALSGNDPAEPGFGTLNLRPYANDSLDAAYHAFKGDSGAKAFWNQFKSPPSYDNSGVQTPGARFVFAITDAASAARYGLRVASLVNGAGQAVAPTSATVTKAINAMPSSSVDPAVRVFDPAVRTAGAYALPSVIYAAVDVCAADKSELSAYSTFIKYAIGTGQVQGEARGQLPDGYVPLSGEQVTAAKATVAGLTKAAKACTPPKSTPTPTATPSTGGGTSVTGPVVGGTDTSTPTSTPSATTIPPTYATADATLASTRFGLAGAFLAGVPLVFVGPFLSARGRKLSLERGGE